MGGFIPANGIKSLDISPLLLIIKTREQVTVVVIVHLDFDFIQHLITGPHFLGYETICTYGFCYKRNFRNIITAAGPNQFAKYQVTIIVQQEISKIIISFFHG